jgi:metallo-beta-lactamase family protein
MAWIKERLPAHGAIFLTHGEDEERTALRAALVTSGLSGDQVVLPQLDDFFELRANGIAAVIHPATPRIDPAQLTTDWHNQFADFTIRLSHRLNGVSDVDKLRVMKELQAKLSELGGDTTPTVSTLVPRALSESQAFDE